MRSGAAGTSGLSIWRREHLFENKENTMDFNAIIADIHQLAKKGIEI